MLILLLITAYLPFILATPLRPTFSSCLTSYSPIASTSSRLNVQNVYANLVSEPEALELGLQGGDVPHLRVNLIGITAARVEGYNNETNKLATLFTDTRTAGINVYSSASWLCNSLFPAMLPQPYYPYNVTYCPLPAGPFAVNLSIPLYKSYALTTLRTQVRIVDTSEIANTLSCVDIQFTPYDDRGWYYQLFLWLPVSVALGIWIVSWGARFAAGWIVGSGVAEYEQKESVGVRVEGAKKEARMRKWGTMIISGLSGERLTVSGGLLRFVTPGVTEIFHHIQFCTILAMISVSWPSFAYPIFAQGAWADLVWNTTLVQGSNPMAKRVNAYPHNYTAPSNYASQMSDPRYPLYLDSDSYNPLLDLYGYDAGMPSFAFAVGLRPEDLFGTCLSIFLMLAGAIIVISLLLWTLHFLLEFFSTPPKPVRPTLGPSPRQSFGAKEIYDGRSLWDTEAPPSLPSQHAIPSHTGPTHSRRILWRFRPKGEAGAFHAAALYGNLLRLILVFHLPVTTFSVYQLTLTQASIVSRVFAGLAFVFIGILVPAGVVLKMKRTASGKLYDATRTLLALGPMYNVYVEDKQMYRVFPLIASLITGIVVGAGQESGLAQAVVLVLVELALLVLPAVWYPWGEGASMGAPNAFLSAIRVVSAVLVMILSPSLNMSPFTDQWITYAILLLQAIVFIFFLLMLITKIVEGIIRLVGGVHFDESTHPLDGGLFGAIADLDCLNPGRGGKAAQRRRRKRGSRQLQRNVSAAGSLTTQMMLDRHSQGVMRPDSQSTASYFGTGSSAGLNGQSNYFTPYAPPLGPPPLERHSSESKHEEINMGGNIMDAWKPVEVPYGQLRSPEQTLPERLSGGNAGKSFAVVRGGRADANSPYSVTGPGRSPSSPSSNRNGIPNYGIGSVSPVPRITSPPPVRVSHSGQHQPLPPHARQQSSHAVIERYDTRQSTGNTPLPSPMPVIYPPGHQQQGMRQNSHGLTPPVLAIPKRRSLNNLRSESPSSDVEKEREKKEKDRKKKRSGFWGRNNNDSEDTESDDEPGPSRRKSRAQAQALSSTSRPSGRSHNPGQVKRSSGLSPVGMREPAPFEPFPVALPDPDEEDSINDKKGFFFGKRGRSLFGLRKKSVEIDDIAEQIRDENKARKAALATESGALLVGVTATPPEKRSFVVKRAGHSPSPSPAVEGSGSASASGSGTGSGSRSFAVKRVATSIASPTKAPAGMVASITSLDVEPIGGSSSSHHGHVQSNNGNNSGSATGTTTPVRSFKVLRPNNSPNSIGSRGLRTTHDETTNPVNTITTPTTPSFKVHRPAVGAPSSPSSHYQSTLPNTPTPGMRSSPYFNNHNNNNANSPSMYSESSFRTRDNNRLGSPTSLGRENWEDEGYEEVPLSNLGGARD